MALGAGAWLGGIQCTTFLHTHEHALSPRLASLSLGKVWLTWHGKVWYGVLAPYHLMCLVEGSFLQKSVLDGYILFLGPRCSTWGTTI